MSQEAYWAFIHNYLVESGPKDQTEWSQSDLATAVHAWVVTIAEAALAKSQKDKAKQCGGCQKNKEPQDFSRQQAVKPSHVRCPEKRRCNTCLP